MKHYRLVILILLCAGCRKDPQTPAPVNAYLKINNVVFNTSTSNNLKDHALQIDTLNFQPYNLQGTGAFAGKTRLVKFNGGGTFQGVPVLEFSGWDNFGSTFIAKDTSGRIMEIFRKQPGSSGILSPQPITVFASKKLLPADEWDSFSGWEQGKNTMYFTFKTKVIATNSTTSTGITGCIQIEHSAPDYKDTIYFKPGKGPVEIRSWRAHLYESNQPGYGGFK